MLHLMILGRTFRASLLGGALYAAFALGAPACGTLDEQGRADSGSCVGLACGPTDAARDQVVADVSQPDGTTDSGTPIRNPLCGTVGCLPDDVHACLPDGGAPSAADTGADAGAEYDASDAAAPPVPGIGCGVVHPDAGQVATECVATGSGVDSSPCVTSTDCARGFACVGDGNAAQCRAYCCGDPNACGKGTFCAERPLKEDPGAKTPLSVPVCVPADNCSLDEPYPCPTGKQCKCKDGTACAVVKDDTTTSCVPPGTGVGGESCPCAAGFVCSFSTQTCLKLCSTNAATPDCGSGKCLSVAYLPEGFGVCALGSDAG